MTPLPKRFYAKLIAPQNLDMPKRYASYNDVPNTHDPSVPRPKGIELDWDQVKDVPDWMKQKGRRVVIKKPGFFVVTFNMGFRNLAPAAEEICIETSVFVNMEELIQTRSNAHVRGIDFGEWGNNHMTIGLDLEYGDEISIHSGWTYTNVAEANFNKISTDPETGFLQIIAHLE